MTASDSSTPAFSVILVAASGVASIARTVWHLRQQTVRRDIELIIVVANEQDFTGLISELVEFHGVRILPIGAVTERGAAAAQGVAQATASIVGLIEDHSFPEPTWAEALIHAHTGECAAVGPAVLNANPAYAASWVNFILAYGAFSPPQQSGPRDFIPWHNSAYKRELLNSYADRLGALLSWEGLLQQDLLRSGHPLLIEAAAQTHHANVSSFRSTIGLNLQRGRMMGAVRVEREQWPRWRQWLHAASFPLYPVMQLRYVLPGLQRQTMSLAMRLKTMCVLVPALFAMALGEARGIVSGVGDALYRLEDYELHRLKHISRRERQEILDYSNRAGWVDNASGSTRDHDAQSRSY